MTTLENICNPLPFILAAWKRVLEKAGHTVYTVSAFDETQEDKKSPYLEIQLTNLRASGQEYPLDGEKYWSSWAGELITRVSTMRGKNGDKHIEMVGGVYVLAARYRNLFVPTVLPHHQLHQIRPSGLVSSTDGLLDRSEIHFDIAVIVRDDAWPDA